jgi:hypothetical protein
MRAPARFPRFGGSKQPWYLLPFVVPWAILAIFFWLCAGIWIVARFATQRAQRGWRALRARRAG